MFAYLLNINWHLMVIADICQSLVALNVVIFFCFERDTLQKNEREPYRAQQNSFVRPTLVSELSHHPDMAELFDSHSSIPISTPKKYKELGTTGLTSNVLTKFSVRKNSNLE